MNGLDFTTLALVTWRISSFFAREDGPWDIFTLFRHKVGVRFDGQANPFGTNVFSKAILCVWCSSPWVGMALAIAYTRGWEGIVYGLAMSTIAVFLDVVIQYLQFKLSEGERNEHS